MHASPNSVTLARMRFWQWPVLFIQPSSAPVRLVGPAAMFSATVLHT